MHRLWTAGMVEADTTHARTFIIHALSCWLRPYHVVDHLSPHRYLIYGFIDLSQLFLVGSHSEHREIWPERAVILADMLLLYGMLYY